MSSRPAGAAQNLEAIYGSHRYLGTITGTTAANTNASTATPFTIPFGQKLLLQGDGAFYVHASPTTDSTGASTAVVVTASNGLKVAQDDPYQLTMGTMQNVLSVLGLSNPFNVKVFALE